MEEDRRCAWIHLSAQRSAVCEQLASPLQSLLVLLRAKVTEGAKGGESRRRQILKEERKKKVTSGVGSQRQVDRAEELRRRAALRPGASVGFLFVWAKPSVWTVHLCNVL